MIGSKNVMSNYSLLCYFEERHCEGGLVWLNSWLELLNAPSNVLKPEYALDRGIHIAIVALVVETHKTRR